VNVGRLGFIQHNYMLGTTDYQIKSVFAAMAKHPNTIENYEALDASEIVCGDVAKMAADAGLIFSGEPVGGGNLSLALKNLEASNGQLMIWIAFEDDLRKMSADDRRGHSDLPSTWSCYSRRRLKILFKRGTLFAWHLYLEAVPLWPRGPGYLKKIGPPRPYTGASREITDLYKILRNSARELATGSSSPVYEFGLLALACRDAAMAAFPSLHRCFDFSRHAPLHITSIVFPLSKRQFDYLLACRRATTRGCDLQRHSGVERQIIGRLGQLDSWCASLLDRVKS
jgi:hypothetical protein